MLGRSSAGLVGAALALAAVPSAAPAAPPANDGASAPGAFAPYTAENGAPSEQQAIAELAEATPDGGVPACLGPLSFARTVWYRIPEQPGPQVITVEAAGRTLDVVDLAAFVQPLPVAGLPPQTQTVEPNACFGVGAGGADAAEEPTSGLTLRVPAQQAVLLQVGRRGTPGSADDERATLSLLAEVEPDIGRPTGDRATAAPTIRADRTEPVDLAGATITDEDPAQPACPSLGTVWRKLTPGRSGKRLIKVTGSRVSTLTVFSGTRPTADNVLDCVNREGRGSLQMVAPARRRTPLWIRLGTERSLDAAQADLSVSDGSRATVIDGGPGGFDPTSGGPAGGFPEACLRAQVERARVSGPRLRGPAGALNRFRRIPFKLVVRGASVCDAEVSLFGPRGRLYAQGRVLRLTGRRVVRLPRLRTIVDGTYRLRVRGVSAVGTRVRIRGGVRGRLR
jgi:hypothetical protein